MKLLRIHHVQLSYPIGQEKEARAFYCDLLGLREIEKPQGLLRNGGFWVELGETQLHIGASDQPRIADSKEHVAFLVDDLKNWQNHFASASISVKKGRPVPGLQRFDIRDPFDNRLEFLQHIET